MSTSAFLRGFAGEPSFSSLLFDSDKSDIGTNKLSSTIEVSLNRPLELSLALADEADVSEITPAVNQPLPASSMISDLFRCSSGESEKEHPTPKSVKSASELPLPTLVIIFASFSYSVQADCNWTNSECPFVSVVLRRLSGWISCTLFKNAARSSSKE